MNSLISEVAVIAVQEKTMLDECEMLMASVAAMQVSHGICFLEHELCSPISQPYITYDHKTNFNFKHQLSLCALNDLNLMLFTQCRDFTLSYAGFKNPINVLLGGTSKLSKNKS